jgi:hypothetical protein
MPSGNDSNTDYSDDDFGSPVKPPVGASSLGSRSNSTVAPARPSLLLNGVSTGADGSLSSQTNDALERQISDLRDALRKEQELRESTQRRLDVANSAIERMRTVSATPPTTTETNAANEAELRREVEQLKRELMKVKSLREDDRLEFKASMEALKAATAKQKRDTLKVIPGPSKPVRKEIMNLCRVFHLDPDFFTEDDITEKDCVQVMQLVVNKKRTEHSRPQAASAAALQGMGDAELMQRIHNLEEELRLALNASEDIRALKTKVIQLVERLRAEKEGRVAQGEEVKKYSRKMEILSDHIEKLMIHLKHEAGAKLKLSDQLKASERRNRVVTEKCNNLLRRVTAKDRLITELREGSKILEDQLRLMDEKYLELRTKLDYTREVGDRKVKKAQKQASELRVKFALAGGTTLLDNIKLPPPSGFSSGPNSALGSRRESFDTPHGGGGTSPLSALSGLRQHPSAQDINAPASKSALKTKSGSNNQSSGGGGRPMSVSWDEKHSWTDEKAEELRVLEKVRMLEGGKQEWNEERIRDLIKSR